MGFSLTASLTAQLPRSIIADRGVYHPVLLAAAPDRLGLDPHDDELAGGELAALLDRLDQALVVQMTVAEVEPDDRVAAELRLTQRVGIDVLTQVAES